LITSILLVTTADFFSKLKITNENKNEKKMYRYDKKTYTENVWLNDTHAYNCCLLGYFKNMLCKDPLSI